MDLSSIEGYEEALRVFQVNVSPRYKALENLDRWINGKQYQGKPDWFSIDVPLWERAPCIVYLLAKESIESKVDLVLGEGRFPDITTSPGEGDPLAEAESKTAQDQEGLNQEDSKLLDAFIERVMKQSGFRAACREVLHHAQEVSSAVLLFGIRKGKLFCDTTKAQWCEPTLDSDGECTKLVIQYPYLDPYKDQWGKWRIKVKIFRRVIDDKTDTTYKPVEANAQGVEPTTWIADPTQVFTHGFGFCPVRWYPFMRGCSTANQIDGKAPHELLLDEIRGLDFALSQRHRAALFAGDPQWTECGVNAGYNPSKQARTVDVPTTGADGKPNGGFMAPAGTEGARQKSPGAVWQYPDVNTKVQLHCLPADALKAVSDNAADLRMKLCEMLAHVPLDADSIRHLVSGKAVDALRKRELNRCDRIRDDVGDGFIVPAIQMLLRICAATKTLKLAGLTRVIDILTRYLKADIPLRLVWGEYSTPDPTEEQAIVTTTCLAHEKGLLTTRQAVMKIRPVFDIENVDEFVDALEEEKAARRAQAMDLEHAMSKLANGRETPPGGKEGKKPAKSGGDAADSNSEQVSPS